jgi:hypothetical protein
MAHRDGVMTYMVRARTDASRIIIIHTGSPSEKNAFQWRDVQHTWAVEQSLG